MHNTDANHGQSGMTAVPGEDSRAKFEAWVTRNELPDGRAYYLRRNEDGTYIIHSIQMRWEAVKWAMTAANGQADERIAELEAEVARLQQTPLAKRCYTQTESHLSGYRVSLGFDNLDDAIAAHQFIASIKQPTPQQEKT